MTVIPFSSASRAAQLAEEAQLLRDEEEARRYREAADAKLRGLMAGGVKQFDPNGGQPMIDIPERIQGGFRVNPPGVETPNPYLESGTPDMRGFIPAEGDPLWSQFEQDRIRKADPGEVVQWQGGTSTMGAGGPDRPVDPDVEAIVAERLARQKERQAYDLRSTLMQSTATPDQAAADLDTAGRMGVSRFEVQQDRNNFDIAKRAKEIDQLRDTAPRSFEWLMQAGDNLEVAHDDVQNLSWWDSAGSLIYNFPGAAYASVVGFGQSVLGMNSMIAEGADETSRTESAVWNALIGNSAEAERIARAQVEAGSAVTIKRDPNAPLAQYSDTLRAYSDQLYAYKNEVMPKGRNDFESGVYSGIVSIGTQAPWIAAAAITKNPGLATAGMTATTAGEAFSRASAERPDLSYAERAGYALREAGIEFVTEVGPNAIIVNALLKGRVKAAVSGYLASRIPEQLGEQAATHLQDLNEWLSLNPDGTWEQYLAARPSAAMQTFVATLVATEGQMGAGKVAAWAGNQLDQNAQQKRSEDLARFIQALGDNAKDSKLLKRLPDKYREAVAAITKDGPVENIRVQSEAFTELAHTTGVGVDQLAKVFNVDAEQVAASIANGEDVVIPSGNYAAALHTAKKEIGITGEAIHSAFAPNIRLRADDFTAKEQAAMKQMFQAEQEARTRAAETDQTFADSADRVREAIREQVVATGMYSTDVANTQAELVGAMVTTLAERTGQDPETLWKEQGFDIVASVSDQRDEGSLPQSVARTPNPPSDFDLKWAAEDLEPKQFEAWKGAREGLSNEQIAARMNEVEPDAVYTPQQVSMWLLRARAHGYDSEKAAKRTADPRTDRIIELRARGRKNADIAQSVYPDVDTQTALNRVKALASKNKAKIEERKAELEGAKSLAQETGSKLPMDEASRMQRAREQGFDVDTPLYVSTLSDLEQFDKHGKFMGHKGISGVSLTDNPKMAERYLDRYGERNYKGEPFKKNMMKVYIRPGKVIELDKPLQSKIGMGFPLPEGYKWPKELDGYDTVVFTDRVSSTGDVAHAPPDDELGILRELTDDPTYQGDALVGREFIVRDPSQIRVAHAAFDPAQFSSSKLLAQETGGTFTPREDRSIIRLFEKRNLATLAHEGAHWYLDTLWRMGQTENPHPFVLEQLASILEWHGKSPNWTAMFNPDGSFTQEGVDLQEAFAETFEAYLREGKAPSVGMRAVFAAFKQWLLRAYEYVAKIGKRVNLNDEIRQVFDRMLVTDEAIKAAQSNLTRDSEAMAKALLEKGVITPKQFEKTKERIQAARERAEAALMARLMDEYERSQKAWWNEELRDTRREVASEIDERPEQRAYQVLSGVGWRDTREAAAEEAAREAEAMLALAQGDGYAGNSVLEAAEWVAAREKGLDLSEEARAARAKAMGFTKRFYHETKSDAADLNEGFDTTRRQAATGDSIMPLGVFVKPGAGSIGIGGTQVELLVRLGNTRTFADRAELEAHLRNDAEYARLADEVAAIDAQNKASFAELEAAWGKAPRLSPEWTRLNGEINVALREWENAVNVAGEAARVRATEVLKAEGLNSITVTKDVGSFSRAVKTTVVLDPKDLRSPDAAFDPDEMNSARLLAHGADGYAGGFVETSHVDMNATDESLMALRSQMMADGRVPLILLFKTSTGRIIAFPGVNGDYGLHHDHAREMLGLGDLKMQHGVYNPRKWPTIAEMNASDTAWYDTTGTQEDGAGSLAQMVPSTLATGNSQALLQAANMADKGQSPEDIWKETGWAKTPDGEWIFEIQGEPRFQPVVGASRETYGNLEDIIDWPELFDAIPKLRGVLVQLSDKTQTNGAFYPEDDVTFTDGTMRKVMVIEAQGGLVGGALMRTLRHEIQHAIQYLGGMASQGADIDVEVYRGTPEFNREVTFIREMEVLFNQQNPDAFREPLSDEDVDALAAYRIYRNNRGEIGAEDIEARSRWTPEKRAVTPPYTKPDGSKTNFERTWATIDDLRADNFGRPQQLPAGVQPQAVGGNRVTNWVRQSRAPDQRLAGRGEAAGAGSTAVGGTGSLAVVHNLTEQNLIHADEIGGLAAPSLAIVDTDKGVLNNFGNITLVADPDFLSSPKVRTFDADIYSPRHPRPLYDINDKAASALLKELREITKGLGDLREIDFDALHKDGPSSLVRNDMVKAAFFASRGELPKRLPRKEIPQVDEATKAAAKLPIMASDQRWQIREDAEIIRLATEHYRGVGDAIRSEDPELAAKWDDRFFYEEDGQRKIELAYLDRFITDVNIYRRAANREVDTIELGSMLSKKLRDKKTNDAFEQYVEDLAARVITGKSLFKGFTNSGNRRYGDYTMETILREMTQELQSGEGWHYGAGSVRAKYANELKSLSAIRARKGQLVTEEEMKAAKDDGSNALMEILDYLKPYYRFGGGNQFSQLDDMSKALSEGPKGIREAFDFRGDPEPMQRIREFIDTLTSLPTEYFEAKAQRAVSLSEFKAAVVPRGTSERALAILKNAGLQIRYYAKDNAEDRARAVRGVGALFHTRTGRPATTTPPTNIPPMRLNLQAVLDQYGEKALAELPPEVAAYSMQANDVEQFVELARNVRKSLGKKHPKSLWKFLSTSRQIGSGNDKISYRGIRDDGGELIKIIGEKKAAPSLISEKDDAKNVRSYTIEQAAMAAWEEGYFNGESPPGPAEFLDALRADLDGSAKLYARDDMATVAEIKNAEEWEAWFDQNGVDIRAPVAEQREKFAILATSQGSNAISPDEAAPFFGMRDGAELLDGLKQGPLRDKLIREETNRRMIERHGDIFKTGKVMEEAQAYARNEIQHRQFEIELDALAQATGQQAASNLAKQQAIENLRSKQVREVLNYNQWLVLERRWAQKAVEAAGKGDMAKAQEYARYRLINSHMYTEGKKLAERIEKTRKHLLAYASKTKLARLYAAGTDYADQMKGLLSDYQLRNESKKAEDKRASRAVWLQAQMAGIDPFAAYGDPTKTPQEQQVAAAEAIERSTMLARLAAGVDATNYKSVTVEELEAVRDEADLIWKLATLKDRLIKEGERRRLSLAGDDIAAEIETNQPNPKPPEPIETDTPGEKFRSGPKKYFAMHRTLQSLAHQFAGGKSGGVFWRYIVRPLNEAFSRLSSLRKEMGADVAKLFSVYTKAEQERFYRDRRHFKGIGRSLTTQGRLAIALNWGNAKNRKRIMDAYGWNEAQVQEVLDSLDKRDWDFVQSVWDYMNQWFPEANRVHEAVHGVPMTKEDPIQVATRFGVYAGGYYPIKFDPMLSSKAGQRAVEADAKKQTGKIGTRTKPGSTIKRVEGKVTMPLRLSALDVISQHLDEVAKSIATEEVLFDVGRILKQPQVEDAIVSRHGRQIYNTIVNQVVTAKFGMEGTSGLLAHLRNGATVVGLSWKVATASLQMLGVSNSIVRVGSTWMARGYAKMGKDAASLESSARLIMEKSEFMRHRREQQSPEMSSLLDAMKTKWTPDFIARVIPRELRGAHNWFVKNGFALMANVQFYSVDMPTWYGAYLKAQNDGASEADAVAMADQAVIDAQGGGELHQLASMQSGAGTKYAALLRVLTNFMSYMVTTYNLGVQRVRNARTTGQIAALALDFVLLAVVPVAGKMLIDALTRGVGGDDEPEEWAERYAREQLAFVFGPFLGVSQFAGSVRGDDAFGYSGPAGFAIFNEMNKLGIAVSEGDFDGSFWRPANRALGMVFHYPAGQIDASVRGALSYFNGETDNPAAFFFGPTPAN